jgi:cadmium resistance protein CadD (predicted permease)
MYRGGRWFGAFILIAVGVVGLVANFNLIPEEIISQLWKLWPLIPLVIGIDILIRRRRFLDDHRPMGGD